MNYNELSGFTENAFALSNSSHGRFKFYSADVTSLEGMEFDSAWSDPTQVMAMAKKSESGFMAELVEPRGREKDARLVMGSKLAHGRLSWLESRLQAVTPRSRLT